MSDISYGHITLVDRAILEDVLATFSGGKMRYLEIGVCQGWTTAGIIKFCGQHSIAVDLFGVDVTIRSLEVDQIPWSKLVLKPSEEAWMDLPDDFDLVFVDGCHCINHVILDAVHYGAKVKSGGFMLFHDTAPQHQHKMTNHWVHENKDAEITKTAVLDGLKKLGWPNDKWKLWGYMFDPESDIGGMSAYQKQ